MVDEYDKLSVELLGSNAESERFDQKHREAQSTGNKLSDSTFRDPEHACAASGESTQCDIVRTLRPKER